jgi:hypothetical protein
MYIPARNYKNKSCQAVVSAIQLTIFNIDEVESFVGGDIGKDSEGSTVIATPAGALKCELNDYIIKFDDGSFVAHKPALFRSIYILAEDNVEHG